MKSFLDELSAAPKAMQQAASPPGLERLLTLPLSKGDLLGGYVLAFGLLAVLQHS